MNYTAKIRTSSQAANLLRDHLGDLDHEELWENQAIVYNAISMPPGQTQKAFPEAFLCAIDIRLKNGHLFPLIVPSPNNPVKMIVRIINVTTPPERRGSLCARIIVHNRAGIA